MKKNYSKIINYILLVLGVIILFVFVSSLDLGVIFENLKLAGFKVVLFLFVFVLLSVLLKAFRWQILIKRISGKDISLWFSFLSIFAGVSSASIFPGRNEITKPLMLKTTYRVMLSKTIPAALIEKILDFIGVMMVFLLAWMFVQAKTHIYNRYILLFVVISVILLLFLFVLPKKLSKIISFIINKLPLSKKLKVRVGKLNKTFFQSFNVLKEKKDSFILFLLSFIEVVIEGIRVYYLFLALGLPITLITASIAFSGSLLLGVLTLIPGGIGITEFSAAFIIKSLESNLELSKIKILIFIDRIVSYYFVVAAGALILLFYQKLVKKK